MAQPLPSKEQTLFRHLVQHYEGKQYKKGIKAADQILRKHPNHGDTQAMKALVLSCQGKETEAFDLCKLALRNAMKSHVCWHVYGLLYRGVRNYEEAIKAYRFALKLEPESPQIARDLALLQMQMRDYPGLVQSRRQAVQAKPGIRSNWTALAVAMHLSGDLAGAEDVLKKFEETLKQPPPKGDLENQEAVLYKISVIAESGDVQRALEQVDAVYKTAVDRTAVMEMRAEYLLKLDKKEEAEKAYRALLDRNAERRAYFEGLEKSLGLDKSKKEDQEKLVQLYQEEANKSERRDAARRIPLDFLEGDVFREHADKYLRKMFRKGVPSTFANIKQLYANPEKKQTIIDLVESYLKEEPTANGSAEPNGSVNGSDDKEKGPSQEDIALNWKLSVNYFLAQHYDYYLSRDLDQATQYVDKAISLNPLKTDYTFHMTRARIIKHRGDIPGASKAMNEAREMDPKDRYINTKCAKYQLRNDENQTALDTMGMFTRKEAVGGPLGDLLEMQCVWYLTEDGESYLRQGKLALAFKRFQQVYNIFETWTEDQFDFHSFSFRKGMIRAYVDMIRWEDGIRQHPFYSRAAQSAIKILTMLADKPELAAGGNVNSTGDAAADKKAAAKARKQAEKDEAEKKAAAAKKANAPAKAEDEGEKKKEDADPQGIALLKQAGEKPLDEAMKYLNPLLELSPKNAGSQTAGFEVYIRRSKSSFPFPWQFQLERGET
jgi:tetratricopeptide (TPR) repeat protein